MGGTPPVSARSPDHYRQLSCVRSLWVSSAQYGCGMLWTTAWARCDSGPGTSHPPGAIWSVISTDPGRVGRSRTNEEEEEGRRKRRLPGLRLQPTPPLEGGTTHGFDYYGGHPFREVALGHKQAGGGAIAIPLPQTLDILVTQGLKVPGLGNLGLILC